MNLRILFCLLACLLFPTAALHAADVNAKVFSVSGTVEFAGPGSSSYAPLQKGQILAIGSTVRTGDDGVAVLVYHGKTYVGVKEGKVAVKAAGAE